MKKKLTDDEKKVRIGLVDDLLKQIEELRKTSNEQVAGINNFNLKGRIKK